MRTDKRGPLRLAHPAEGVALGVAGLLVAAALAASLHDPSTTAPQGPTAAPRPVASSPQGEPIAASRILQIVPEPTAPTPRPGDLIRVTPPPSAPPTTPVEQAPAPAEEPSPSPTATASPRSEEPATPAPAPSRSASSSTSSSTPPPAPQPTPQPTPSATGPEPTTELTAPTPPAPPAGTGDVQQTSSTPQTTAAGQTVTETSAPATAAER